jgi:hypothetical protein
MKRAPLHRRDPLTQPVRGVRQGPCFDDRADRTLDVSAVQGRVLGLPGGRELRRRDEPGRRGRAEHERPHPVGRDQRGAQGHRAAEGVADERCPLDAKLVQGSQDIRPRGVLGLRQWRLPEAGQIQGDRAKAGVGQRLQVLVPHRPVGDAGMQQHHWRAASKLIARQHRRYTPAPAARTLSIARTRAGP